ncbi:MAG: hypothetical protein E7458_09645 [Ruminococcaceae bacterium]|nr:hypothetical protein [Oscillospiraceae bacterium]
MMKWILIVPVLILLLYCLAGCVRSGDQDTEIIDGGQVHHLDEDAPKEIESTEIVAFSCEFSTTDIPMNESPVAGRYYTLYAGEDGGRFEERAGGDIFAEHDFTPDAAFFDRLQQIVSAYDLARYNGAFTSVAGLPPDLGAKLSIRYASGESIRAADNQDSFLPLEAMEDLVALFHPNTSEQE